MHRISGLHKLNENEKSLKKKKEEEEEEEEEEDASKLGLADAGKKSSFQDLKLIAEVSHENGRTLKTFTDQPGVQLYTGKVIYNFTSSGSN